MKTKKQFESVGDVAERQASDWLKEQGTREYIERHMSWKQCVRPRQLVRVRELTNGLKKGRRYSYDEVLEQPIDYDVRLNLVQVNVYPQVELRSYLPHPKDVGATNGWPRCDLLLERVYEDERDNLYLSQNAVEVKSGGWVRKEITKQLNRYTGQIAFHHMHHTREWETLPLTAKPILIIRNIEDSGVVKECKRLIRNTYCLIVPFRKDFSLDTERMRSLADYRGMGDGE